MLYDVGKYITISSIEKLWKLVLNYITSGFSSKLFICVFLIIFQTLRDELQKMTKTAIRRKENLKDRKLKKKQAKNGDVFEEVSTPCTLVCYPTSIFSTKFLLVHNILFSYVFYLRLFMISF